MTAVEEQFIALSGGTEKSKFNVLGKILSQQELVDLLIDIGFKNVLHKSNKKTILLLIPDHVLDASDSSRQRASDRVQVQHISSFIKLHKLEPILQTKLFGGSKSNTLSSSSSLQTTKPTAKTVSSKINIKEHSVSQQQEKISSSRRRESPKRQEKPKKKMSDREDDDGNSDAETNESDDESSHFEDSEDEEEKKEKEKTQTKQNYKKTQPNKVYLLPFCH